MSVITRPGASAGREPHREVAGSPPAGESEAANVRVRGLSPDEVSGWPLESTSPWHVAGPGADEVIASALQGLFGVGLNLQGLAITISDPRVRGRLVAAVDDLDRVIDELRAHVRAGRRVSPPAPGSKPAP